MGGCNIMGDKIGHKTELKLKLILPPLTSRDNVTRDKTEKISV